MPLDSDQVVAQAKRLLDFHESERSKLDEVRRYWKGLQKLPPVIPASAPREVRLMASLSRVNVCEIIVDTMAQSLFVDGFRLPRQADNVAAWRVWQSNKMDREQSGVHRAATAYGAAYVVVMPGRGETPVIRGVSPRRLTALYGDDPDWPRSALERRSDNEYRLYDDEAVYTVERERGFTAPLEHTGTDEHGMGFVPVVRFRDRVDLDADDDVGDAADRMVLGQVGGMQSLQDQVDLTTFGLLVAQHFAAFKQRYILGWVADDEAERMAASAARIWTFEDHPEDVRIGELSETELKGYIDSRESTVKFAATLSQTPPHELVGQLINLSADALAAADAGRDRKIDETKTSLGESWEQVFSLAGGLIGEEIPDDAQVVWRDTSARSFAAIVDGLGKLAQMLGIPPQELWERVPGATQQDVERWRAVAEQGNAFDQLERMLSRQAEPDAEPSGNGAEPVVVAS